MEENPALKLIDYFSQLDESEGRQTSFETSKLEADSGMKFGKIGGEDVRRMVGAWRKSGYLSRERA